MSLIFKDAPVVKKITTRPVKARAMQFLYMEDCGDTRIRAETIEATLGVKLSRFHDPQSGTGYSLRMNDFDLKSVGHRDWIIVDSFGKANVVKDAEFKVYYEPE